MTAYALNTCCCSGLEPPLPIAVLCENAELVFENRWPLNQSRDSAKLGRERRKIAEAEQVSVS